MGALIFQGIEAEEFFAKLGEIVDEKVTQRINEILPKESPDDLLTYDDIARIFNMASKDHISTKVSTARVQQFTKDGRVAITRAEAEKIFRKTKS